MKYGLIVLVLMVSLELVYGAELTEKSESEHPADATAVKDDSLHTYTNNQYFQSPEELQAFFADRTDLEVMVFRSFALRNDFSDTFGNILSQMKHLRRLTLARTQFTLSQLESIIRNLDFSQLESLNLGDTRIGPRGVLVLATYLSRARQLALKELDLRGCFMEDAGAAAIIQLLPKLPNLKVLNLMENNITDASAIPLLGVLPTMEHLTHFLVSANPKVSASTWKNFERFASSPGVHFVEFGYGSY